jgi:hypothetical protein
VGKYIKQEARFLQALTISPAYITGHHDTAFHSAKKEMFHGTFVKSPKSLVLPFRVKREILFNGSG